MQKKLIFLLFCLTATSNIFADYSCNAYSYQDAFSLCSERVKFSKEIDKSDETEYGWIGFLKYYDQSDKLKELLKSGDYLNASKLFYDHKDYFLKKKGFKKYHESLSKIANNLNNNYQVEVDELEKLLIKLNNKLNKSDITETKGRDTFNNIVKFKEQLKLDYRSHQLLRYREFRGAIFSDIEELIPKTREALNRYKKQAKISFFNSESNDIADDPPLTWSKFVGYVFAGMFALSMLLLLVINVSDWFSSINKKPIDDAEKKRLLSLWKKRVTRIKRANSMLSKYLNNDTGYFSNYQENYWLSQHRKLLDEIHGQSYGRIGLADSDIEVIKQFISNNKDISSLRKNFNASFIDSELKTYSNFFNKIEGRPLDDQQRKAVVTDEDNNLIVAGAGSGKTTTIIGKVNYVLDKYKVDPEKVLLISFTRRSAGDLKKRLKKDEVKVKTFHSFGMEVLKEVEGNRPKTLDDDENSTVFTHVLTKSFKASLEDRKYINKVNKFVTDYLREPKSEFDFKTRGDYYQYLRDQDFSTFKRVPSHPNKTTFKREVVKSIEECKIANFLLFNGIDYKYEAKYKPYLSFNYFPDFSLIQDGETIYLEHFGINNNWQVPPFFARDGETHKQATKRYLDDRDKKIQLHKNNSTTLIQTFSYEIWNNDESFYDMLKQRLIDAGIRLNPKTPEEIWQIINDFYRYEEKDLIKLFGTFITLMKSNQSSISVIKNKAEKIEDRFLRKRSQLFLDIIKPIYDGYEAHLVKEKVIDFSDMINKATKHISSRKYKKKISYVIIDEFQDISIGRYNLVKAIKRSNPGCRLFCVGDDWQSIYRFTGSDIALFKDFSKYFGVTEQSKIETTYRFHNPLIDLSSQFIQQNPNQVKKELHSIDGKKTNYKIKYSKGRDDTSVLIDIFNELTVVYDNIEDKKITILARHNFDLKKWVKNEDELLSIDKKNNISYQSQTEDGGTRNIHANFQSVHSAKGLEADIVIIINCNAGKHGFPNQMSDDPTLNLLLSEADQFENGEERRLFYVAMTRAKEMLYLIADSANESKFISEISIEDNQNSKIKCPICKKGNIELYRGRAKTGNRFIGYNCSNWAMFKCPGKGMVYENQSEWVEDDY